MCTPLQPFTPRQCQTHALFRILLYGSLVAWIWMRWLNASGAWQSKLQQKQRSIRFMQLCCQFLLDDPILAQSLIFQIKIDIGMADIGGELMDKHLLGEFCFCALCSYNLINLTMWWMVGSRGALHSMYKKKSKLRLLKRSEAERKHISIYIFFWY